MDNSVLSRDIKRHFLPIVFAHMARGPLSLAVCPTSSLPRAVVLPVLPYL